ncbi:peptidylprolyl isomerase [Legionella jordanis]|uniref:Chaperone SurA n=1 Tax=Legionella jordanis TaxID=456 RepID=A0A0W0VC17_9GAMM|nr:peptidylprolyl isomerase [Legionella jordanis]KTD17655.1 peptidyl-prolyl cis-trans isomerase D [Legionella jordanis]RMX01527.1 molecular chaperone SurA [Legionella jordanis]RMX21522.1 molecular chaperone SurA [Legionella jordanis]VEH11416.1 peptidyl-prolyl cis-trans isomerase D [Legionella jordanis]HAT8715083.1 molecular chaperone SurA [Legionella jordanis]
MLKRIALLMLLLPALTVAKAAQPLDKVIAVVNDGVITESELNTQVELLRQQIQAKHMQLPTETELRKQVLQHLIDVDLQLQLAKQNDITVDNTDLDDAIAKIATANNLSLTQLREEITRQGLTWSTYKENIRKEMLISKLQQKAVGKDVTVTPKQVEDFLKTGLPENKNQLTYHVQNIVIPVPEEPTTEQVNKAREKAKELLGKIKKGEDFNRMAIAESSGEFALEGGDLGERHLAELPEIFAKQVVNMKTGEVAGPIRTGNGFQLIKLIAIGGKEEHHEVTKTHVRHILLKPDASMTVEEAQRQANNLYQQLKSGKDFALMAKQYSLDAASAVKGGDLGWVNSGELVPEFEKAMNNLALHTISKPVKTMFGWHIIEVLERKKIDDSESYKKEQVRQFLTQRKFTEAVQNWQQHIRSSAYINVMDKELA